MGISQSQIRSSKMEFTGDRILTPKMAEDADMASVLPAGAEFISTMKFDGSQWTVDTPSGDVLVGGTEVDEPASRWDTSKTYEVRVLPYQDGTVDVLSMNPVE